ncbi:hypothetical protein AHF37_12560 [Paragonimus kellicotti]|nr:hypothetical protein AHF37_12560 [Paragonimus kellicotti]
MKYCPIFRLGDILKYSDASNKDIWQTGGMVSIHIEWNCNLDFDAEKCRPKYVFRRLDDFESPVAKGWNFRFSQHYMENGVRKRNLIKAHGIQFFITVYGTGGKFNVLTFSMNLGSGLALLGIATVLCDMIVLNTTRKRGLYRKAKVDLVAQRKAKERLSKQIRELERRQKENMEALDNDKELHPKDDFTQTEFNRKDSDLHPTAPSSRSNCFPSVSNPSFAPVSLPSSGEICWSDTTCTTQLPTLGLSERSSVNHSSIQQPSLMGVHLVEPSGEKNPPGLKKWKKELGIPENNHAKQQVQEKPDNDQYIPRTIMRPFGPPTIHKLEPRSC